MLATKIKQPTLKFLIVDDEPDVIEITELVLEDFTYRDMPVHLVKSHSAEEARALLQPTGGAGYHLALIDVVMESDLAGVELCEFIRKDLDNSDMELYIRTGQAGRLEEADVMRRTNINGFYEKAGISDSKLECLAIQGAGLALHKCNQQIHAHYASLIASSVPHTSSRKEMLDVFQQAWGRWDGFLRAIEFRNPITNGFMYFEEDDLLASGGFEGEGPTMADVEEVRQYPLLAKIADVEVRQQGSVLACINPAFTFAVGHPKAEPADVRLWGGFIQVLYALFVSAHATA